MSDAEETVIDEPAAPPSDADNAMAAVDSALAPALKMTSDGAGPVHHSELAHALACVRQALAHAIYGAPPADETTGESLDTYGDAKRARRRSEVEAQEAGNAALQDSATEEPAGEKLFA